MRTNVAKQTRVGPIFDIAIATANFHGFYGTDSGSLGSVSLKQRSKQSQNSGRVLIARIRLIYNLADANRS